MWFKRYTDDRIRMIKNAAVMTPRYLAERTGVSTAAISQWSKGMIEKGVLDWCDESGAVFGNDLSLEKAKRTGRVYLSVAGGKCLPSPFQLTGDPRWEKDGDLWGAYDLALGAQKRWIRLHHPERLSEIIKGVKFVDGIRENRITA